MGGYYSSKKLKLQKMNEVVSRLRNQDALQTQILTRLALLSTQTKEEATLLQEQAVELKTQKNVLEREVSRLRHIVTTLQELNR
jgi:hypothetical protein